MRKITSMRVDKDFLKKLDLFKVHYSQSYQDVVERIIRKSIRK